jgi:cobalt-zinc-cadmium efflux system outer membrane protein
MIPSCHSCNVRAYMRATLVAFPLVTATAHPAQPLGLAEAAELALIHQPLLEGQRSAIAGAEQDAIAASQLPDPKLKFGLQDYPITGSDAFSFTRDSFTMLTLGVSQDFPREAKRRLRGTRGEIEAQKTLNELELLRRTIARDAALAWLDAYNPERALEFVQSLQRESEYKIESLEIGLRSGRASLAEVLAEKVNLDLLKDRGAEFERQAERARANLTRWIGADAFRPTTRELPEFVPPGFNALLAQVAAHPHLDTLDKQVELAENAVALARENYKPDWSLELSYGLRPQFSDFIGVQAGIELPVFPKNRQDRELASKLFAAEHARAQREDALRVMQADARRHYADWQSASSRLAGLFDQAILPRAKARVEAAAAAYRAGRGDINTVLEARRAELEAQLQRLQLETDRARAAVQLAWFSQ